MRPGEGKNERWLWPVLPWAAAGLLFFGAMILPGAECSVSGPTTGRGPFVVIAVVAIGLLVGGAVLRTLRLAAGPHRPNMIEWLLLVACTATSAYFFDLNDLERGLGAQDVGEELLLAGFLLAVAVYVVMAVEVSRKGAEGAGIVVPISLLFVAGMILLPVAELAYAFSGGALC